MNGPFDERTGHPHTDNAARNANRAIRRLAHDKVAFHLPRATRIRRKQVRQAERRLYAEIVAHTITKLSTKETDR